MAKTTDHQGRGSQYVLRLNIWSIMLDGKGHSTSDFAGLGCGPKQVLRILHELEQVPILRVYRAYNGKWKSDFVAKAERAKPTQMICGVCNVLKPISEFYTASHRPSGYDYKCKPCAKEANKRHRALNKSRVNMMRRKYYRNHIEEAREYRRGKYQRNKDKELTRSRAYYLTNRDKILEQKRLIYAIQKDRSKQVQEPIREDIHQEASDSVLC